MVSINGKDSQILIHWNKNIYNQNQSRCQVLSACMTRLSKYVFEYVDYRSLVKIVRPSFQLHADCFQKELLLFQPYSYGAFEGFLSVVCQ